MAILPTSLCRFNAIPIKIPAGFFVNIDDKIHTEIQESHSIQHDLEKKNRVERFTLNQLQSFLQSYSSQNSVISIWIDIHIKGI